ncbi:MAG TPA: N-acetylmuramoyl-L-alanine amidase [Candidatus Babeliales bacterium]|nr:N-acetylmuramoyl-L-alanine amidase [Candidatus Babeliales bacterium]
MNMGRLMGVIIVTPLLVLCKEQANQVTLNKLFHHKAPEHHLELGNVAFYFSHEPEISLVPQGSKKDGQQTVVYFFHGAKLDAGTQQMVRDFNKKESDRPYSASIAVVKNGIKLTISYDTDKVYFDHKPESFVKDPFKGILFKFYNKELLTQLNTRGDALLRTAYMPKKKPTVVVDCGHGGPDAGTIGHKLQEKDITLDVGLLVAQLLRDDGFTVLLTRDSDRAVALDERTTFANFHNADLFVSIHANNSPKDFISGIETYCLHDSLFKPCMPGTFCPMLMSAHKATQMRNQHSTLLANLLHVKTISQVKKKYADIVNRGIKHMATQVLLGTVMPAVLIEIGFLSNELEAQLLSNSQYQQLIAQGIRDGIVSYARAEVTLSAA